MPDAVYLDPFSSDVLWMVCHGGPYLSSVVIASDLDDLGKITNREGAWGMVEAALDLLNCENLVRYSVGEHGVMIHVRATEEGFTYMGFPPAVRIVGARHSDGSHAPDFPGDMTDWRNHKFHATGVGPIERMPLREHLTAYWSHAELHFEQLWELEEVKG